MWRQPAPPCLRLAAVRVRRRRRPRRLACAWRRSGRTSAGALAALPGPGGGPGAPAPASAPPCMRLAAVRARPGPAAGRRRRHRRAAWIRVLSRRVLRRQSPPAARGKAAGSDSAGPEAVAFAAHGAVNPCQWCWCVHCCRNAARQCCDACDLLQRWDAHLCELLSAGHGNGVHRGVLGPRIGGGALATCQ